MVGINKGIDFATLNFSQRFITCIRSREEDSVKEGVAPAFTSEVVIGWLGDRDLVQIVVRAEEVKQLRAF